MIATDLLKDLLDFRREREWERFHTPKNLSAALTVEAAELLECFQWAADADVPSLVTNERPAIERELADIAILLAYICHDLGVDLNGAVRAKIEENRKKYPVDLSRGRATKYDRL